MPPEPFSSLKPVLIAAADIVVLALVIYWLLTIVRGTRAFPVLVGTGAVVVTYTAADYLGLVGLVSFLGYLAPFTGIALVVLFQSEIRRSLSRLGRWQIFGVARHDQAIEDILPALRTLSSSGTGALIAVENTGGLRTFVESGVRMDAHVSSGLLIALFQKNSPLHDGAVIIQKGTIAAAACFLPLTTRPLGGVHSGSRHRAAVGITEDTDCISFVVSETSGDISVASEGVLRSGLSPDEACAYATQRLSSTGAARK